MGVLADLIVAEMADTQSIVTSDYPLETFKGSNIAKHCTCQHGIIGSQMSMSHIGG